jgi:hypothetical protein
MFGAIERLFVTYVLPGIFAYGAVSAGIVTTLDCGSTQLDVNILF